MHLSVAQVLLMAAELTKAILDVLSVAQVLLMGFSSPGLSRHCLFKVTGHRFRFCYCYCYFDFNLYSLA